jgi:hypothetical protein
VLLATATVTPSRVASAPVRFSQAPPAICDSETWQAFSSADDLVAPNDQRVRIRLSRALTLFRFDRAPEAFRKLETAVEVVAKIVDSRVSAEQRMRATTNIARLQTCLKSTRVPPLATLIVQPLDPDGGNRPMANMNIRVEDLPVGTTGRDGTLRVRVPSGKISVQAWSAPTIAGEREVTLSPKSVTTLRVPLDDSKDSGPQEESAMTLAEAIEDVVPAGTRSLTFRFETDDGPVRVASISRIDVYGSDGEVLDELTEAFDLGDDGTIVARDASSLLKELGQREPSVTIRVIAGNTFGLSHVGRVTLRVR